MNKNKFDRINDKDSIPEVSVPKAEEVNTTETTITTEPTEKKLTFPLPRGRVYAEGFDKIRIREEPNANAKIIAEVPVGKEITLGDTVNGWTKVCWVYLEGWMMDKYIARYR